MKKYKLIGLLLLISCSIQAQVLIEREQRLSEWLQARPAQHDDYALGLMWTTPEELQRQQHEHQSLLAQQGIPSRLQAVIETLKPTGRVPQSAAHGYWLEAYPRKDPLMKVGDTVTLPKRPMNIRVISGDGLVCEISHKQGLLAVDYLDVCNPQNTAQWAWLVEADGRIQRVGVKNWNLAQQNQPAPGAWVWAPDKSLKLSDEWHSRFARWLAVQGPSTRQDLSVFPTFERQVVPRVSASSVFDWSGRQMEVAPSFNNWGLVGLIQTPTARMMDAGGFGLTVHNTYPYHWLNFIFQPLEWMEAGFRYTTINNRLYSPNAPEWSHYQSLLDKSIDVKARLWRESDWVPSVAVGMRDVGGTGLFSSEYVVASKRTGRFDWSGGIAWGNMGGRGDLSNPLSKVLGSRYDQRVVDVGQGGKFGTSAWFRGPAALFGGVEYQTPWNFSIKAEYDGNNYQHDPWGNVLAQKSAVNWAVVFKPYRWLDVSTGYERGNTWSVGVTLYTDMANLHVPKVTAPPTPTVRSERPLEAKADIRQTAEDIDRLTLWDVKQISVSDAKWVVEAKNTMNPYPDDRLDKAMAVIHRDAPATVEEIEIRHHAAGDSIAVERVQRQAWVVSQTQPERVRGEGFVVPLEYDVKPDPALTPTLPNKAIDPSLETGLDLLQTTGGPDGYLYQFQGSVKLGVQMPWSTKISSTLAARLYDNYQNFIDEGASNMPRVRTYTKQFLTTSRYTLADLSLSNTQRLSSNWYWTGYVGYFETMFGGVGSEVLYRQPGSRWGVGMDYNRVRMRDFHQNFAFQEFRANTGHVTGYWETPFEGIMASLSAGQYLAGDKGYTMSVSKTFHNGTTLIGYFTKTNVPPEVFGEGSFDKGIALKIPFDAFLTSHSRYSAGWSWKPLVRDGGAILTRPVNLFSETGWLSPTVKDHRMAPASNDHLAPDDHVYSDERRR